MILIFIGFWVSGEAEVIFQEKDSEKIVVHDILGYLVAIFLLPPTWANIFVAFLLFKFFDAIKLFPANVIEEQVLGGYGVVLDDVVPGIGANLIKQEILFSQTYLATTITLTNV